MGYDFIQASVMIWIVLFSTVIIYLIIIFVERFCFLSWPFLIISYKLLKPTYDVIDLTIPSSFKEIATASYENWNENRFDLFRSRIYKKKKENNGIKTILLHSIFMSHYNSHWVHNTYQYLTRLLLFIFIFFIRNAILHLFQQWKHF